MKNLSLCCALSAAIAVSYVRAQGIEPQPGYGFNKLFDSTPGFTITGLGAGSNGDLFYIESPGFGSSAQTTLYRRTAASAYTIANPLFSLGASIYGSFVSVNADTVYFGESSSGMIRSIRANGTDVDLLGQVEGSYDGVFAQNALFLSYNASLDFNAPQSAVARFELESDGSGGLKLGAGDLIVDAGSDYSGPIAINAEGSIYYGTATGRSAQKGVYEFSAVEVSGAFGPGQLTLGPSHFLLSSQTTSYISVDGSTLWQTNASALNRVELSASLPTLVGTSTQSIGHLAPLKSGLAINVTDFSTNRSAVLQVIPEPASSMMVAFAAGLLFVGRRRHSAA